MALIKCHECGKKVSTESPTCPGCGAIVKIPEPKNKSASLSAKSLGRLFMIFIIGIILVSVVSAFFKKDKTPQELKQEAEAQKIAQTKKAEDEKKTTIKTKRVSAAATAAQAIQRSARNPQNVAWEGILANDDASVICFELRAQNGFGGLNVEQIAVIKGVMKTSDSAWNKNCADKELYDVKSDVIRLLKIYN